MYQLYYWPGLPGRGEFVRLVLEQAGQAYQDVGVEQGFDPVAALRETAAGFAPPYLQQGDQFLAQVPAICFYLGVQHELLPDDAFNQAKAQQLFLTVMDVVTEVHDTHHPISVALTYEEQSEAAAEKAASFLNGRLQKWLAFFDRQLGGDFLQPGSLTVADLSLFQLVEGIGYAFPMASRKYLPASLAAHNRRVATLPRIAEYLKSDRRQQFNEMGIFRHYPELDLAE